MQKEPVISIIGGTIWGNRGAEAMLTTCIGRLRDAFPQARFNIFSYYPQKDRELVADKRIQVLSAKPLSLATRHFFGALLGAAFKKLNITIPASSFFKAAHALSTSDVLLDIGGITFSDGREKFLPFNILSIWPAMLLGVPVVKMSQALGPFRKALNRCCAAYFLRRCRHIYARGEQTVQHLDEINLPRDQYDPATDMAFLYEPRYSLSHENEDQVQLLVSQIKAEKKRGRKVIVFSPSVLVENESRKKGLDYGERFLDVVRSLPSGQFFYLFMPNATRAASQKPHNNDLLTIMNIKQQAQQDNLAHELFPSIAWVDYDINTDTIRQIVAQADVLVTSRYHAMISGLCLAVPTIVMGWGHKYLETMRYFDLQDYSLDFSNTSISLCSLIEKALHETVPIQQKIRNHQKKVRDLSEQPFLWLKDLLS